MISDFDIAAPFCRALRPAARLAPAEWASGRVVIADGLTPKYQIENAPWQIEPLNTLADADAKEVVFLAPVGTGKTTFMEAALMYIISEDPGPTLLVGQTDDDLKDWAETRMDYAVRNTPDTAALLPNDRHKKQKMKILFPHMAVFLTGANLSGLQSKSMRRVFNDEAWQYTKGMLNESRGRLHDRWNRQFFILSQAGVVDDDLDKAWKNSDQREFCYTCPSCGTVQPWRWCNVVMDDVVDGDLLTAAQSVRLKCGNEECDWTCGDNTQRRRELAEGARYIPTAKGLPGHIGFHYNVLCNWRKPLWEIALSNLEAKAAMRQGNLEPLRQFIQKRLAEPWQEDLTDNRTTLVGSDYTMTEFADGKKIDGELYRFLTVDVQRDHFWVVVRAWAAEGVSQKLHFARVETIESVEQLRIQYGVEAKLTFIDAQYNTDRVYIVCAQYGWTALHGASRDSFPHKGKDGKFTYRPYAKFADATATNGRKARYAHWSSDRIKDILYAHRIDKTGKWRLPDDVSQEYLKQIDAERKQEVQNSTTKQVEHRWTKIRRDNHAWDVEAMQIVAALMLRLLPGFDG